MGFMNECAEDRGFYEGWNAAIDKVLAYLKDRGVYSGELEREIRKFRKDNDNE